MCYLGHIVFAVFPCVSFNLTHMPVVYNFILQGFTKIGRTPSEFRAAIRLEQRCAEKKSSVQDQRVSVPVKLTHFNTSVALVKNVCYRT